jgi:ABC-2 type transport system permease protein
MGRILTIAQSEFLTLVKTKAFIFGILMTPALMTGFITFMNYAEKHVDTTDRAVAVIDQTGVLYEPLASAAAKHNEEAGSGEAKKEPHFLLSRVDLGSRSVEDVTVDLSKQIKTKQLFAFMILPASLLDPGSRETAGKKAVDKEAAKARSMRLYAQTTSTREVRDWIEEKVNDEIARQRFKTAGIDQALVERLTTRAEIDSYGLVERNASGATVPAKEVDDLSRMGVPTFILVLMFIAVITGAMHLLNAVIEEKMSKISEVLLGSATPLELMAGKLIGIVSVSIVLTIVYLVGGIYVLTSFGRADLIDPRIIGWFFIFMILAALMFGSLFLAVGSACSDLKDSQSMVQPVMMLILLAYLGSFVVMRSPESAFAVGLSFVPTMTPFTMMLRLVQPPGPPLWQVLLSIVLLAATTAGILWAASRIFRVGLLMQGKPPTIPELIKWVRL